MADGGPDQTVQSGDDVRLAGHVAFSNTPPSILWRLYSGPDTPTFANAARTNSTVTFSAPGSYTLVLSADDGVHAVACDAVVIHVVAGIRLLIERLGADVRLSWTGGSSPFTLERKISLTAPQWETVTTTDARVFNVPLSGSAALFRLLGN